MDIINTSADDTSIHVLSPLLGTGAVWANAGATLAASAMEVRAIPTPLRWKTEIILCS